LWREGDGMSCAGCEIIDEYGHEVLLDNFNYKLTYVCVDSGHEYRSWRGVDSSITLRCKYNCPECGEIYEVTA
tara:strand:+ start:178 stop:396 length:219 start_codon:yes stop_codon:yes gene_type:complete